MSVRRAIIESDPSTFNVTQFCKDHGVSTWFFWDLRRRYRREGDVVLEPKSRAAHTVANRTPSNVEEAVIAERKRLADVGLDAGPATIRFHLADLPGVPSEATIWRILKSRGFIEADPSKRPKRGHRSFTAERANECWQLDDTAWQLADGTDVKVLNVIDDHSRLLVASSAMVTCTGAATLAALAAAAAVLGWPARFLSDNARAFCHVLADALAKLGVRAGHSRPSHPQTCGKVERFHQTLKKWLAKQPPATTIDDLQTQLDLFRLIYNHHRPHRSIGRRFPADVWATAAKSGPADQPIGTPTQTYNATISGGRVDVSRNLRITVGAAYNGLPATVVITADTAHVFIAGHHIRRLAIDPTKRNQPLYDRPGPPPAPTINPTKRKAPRHA
ncbi:integrase core domain-containing protein [Desertimonas flava]|uniref:integrase core domain-containing protein n=1 Tax=Desertimonas flava TaxID=2064846 RepID=UPI0013C4008D|nr:integrase core domain-containing protein [Desertimonas flava]